MLSLCSFFDYVRLEEKHVLSKYAAVEHWAKLEKDKVDPDALQKRMQLKYPQADINAARARRAPKTIMGNSIVNTIFPRDDVKS